MLRERRWLRSSKMAKTKIFSITGGSAGEVELPSQFSEQVRPDLISRAVIAAQHNRMQPHGNDPRAGKRSSAKYKGTRKGWGHSYNYGQSRIPRLMLKGGRRAGRAKIVPQAVGGYETHGPKVIENHFEFMNAKERLKAIRSAIAATASLELVKERGHAVSGIVQLPIIVEEKFESITRAKEAHDALKALGVMADIERTIEKKKIRPGVGKLRGRKYKVARGPLIIVSDGKNGISKAASNISGVDVVDVKRLNAEHLAPGAKAGRLAVWSAGAIAALSGGLFKEK